jgi:hypothetical protein
VVVGVLVAPTICWGQFDLTPRPTTYPTTLRAKAAPATRPVVELKKCVRDLASLDSDVREAARKKLMGLGLADLETLRTIVSAGPKLTTSQVSLLRDVVIHVHVASQPYEMTTQALLGVRDLAGVKVAKAQEDKPGEEDKAEAATGVGGLVIEGDGMGRVLILPNGIVRRVGGEIGVVVSERMPGFCAYRHLDNGDVILTLKDDQVFRPRTVWDFQVRVRQHAPGDRITLEVLRRGKLVDVTLELDGYPACALGDPQAISEKLERFRREREGAAEEYWQEKFGVLVGEPVS